MKRINKKEFVKAKVNIEITPGEMLKTHPAVILFPDFDTSSIAS